MLQKLLSQSGITLYDIKLVLFYYTTIFCLVLDEHFGIIYGLTLTLGFCKIVT